jgi:hypothetical protein
VKNDTTVAGKYFSFATSRQWSAPRAMPLSGRLPVLLQAVIRL